MTSTDVDKLTAALLRQWGCPPLPGGLWTPSAARRFLHESLRTRPGSVRELALILGIVNPGVRVEATRQGLRHLLVRITWRRWKTPKALVAIAPQAGALVAATERLLAWWKPLGLTLQCEILWPGGSLMVSPRAPSEFAMSRNDRLLEQFAGRFLGVRRHEPVPPRTWVSLGTEGPLARAPHEVVLGDVRLERFLFNIGHWKASVRVVSESIDPGRTALHLTALRELGKLELVGPVGLDQADFRLDGRPLVPASWPRRPDHYVFLLPDGVRPGESLNLICTYAAEAGPIEGEPRTRGADRAEGVRFWVNPALFEACQYHPVRREYRRDYRAGADEDGSYPNIVAGGAGIKTAKQPFPLDEGEAEESDDSLFCRARQVMLGRYLIRRHDVTTLVAGRFRGVDQVECSEEVWHERDRSGWLREVRGVRVQVRCSDRDEQAVARLKAGLERYLSRHLPAGLTIRVEVATGGDE